MQLFLKIILISIFFLPLTTGFAEEVSNEPASKQPIVLDTLEFRDMDINDVLKLFSAKTGLNIIAGKTISGKVTVFLKDVEAHDALTIILKANDLAYIEDRGVIQVVTSAEYELMAGRKFGVQMQSAVVALKSFKASDAMVFLSQLKSAAGKIVADDESNSLILEESPDHLVKMLDYIKMIDIPTELKVFQLKFTPAEALAAKLQEMLSPKIGSVKIDGASNKLLIKDTAKKLADIEEVIKHIDIPRQTQVFKISYAKAEDLVKTVTPVLSKDLGNIQFDSRSNVIIVTDTSPKIKEIESIINALDKIDKEVLIEAKIVQIELNDAYQMGINWEELIPNLGHSVVDLKNNFSLPGAVSPVSMTTIGTLTRENYSVVLQMISKLGKSKLLSNPRIAVINNQEAKIMVGSQPPYVTDATTTPASGPTTTAETVNFVDTGVKLHVTPMIHDDNYITMKIKPEVSNIPKSITTSNNNQIPVVDTSEVETTIRVKDGVTIIIGGLIKDEYKNTKNKIPILGDLPLLGKAFRNETRSMDKTETVIFLTPHIISGDVHVDPEKFEAPTIKANKTYYNPFFKDEQSIPVP